MKLLGRMMVVMGLSALVGCGVEGSEADVGGIASQTSEINSCPQLVPPGPGFCEFGTIVPVYDSNKCIVSYDCI